MVSDQPIWTALILPQLDCADLKFETLACMANTLSFLANHLRGGSHYNQDTEDSPINLLINCTQFKWTPMD